METHRQRLVCTGTEGENDKHQTCQTRILKEGRHLAVNNSLHFFFFGLKLEKKPRSDPLNEEMYCCSVHHVHVKGPAMGPLSDLPFPSWTF